MRKGLLMDKTDNKNKEKKIEIRLSQQEYEDLEILTYILGKNRSEIIREYVNDLSKMHIKR